MPSVSQSYGQIDQMQLLPLALRQHPKGGPNARHRRFPMDLQRRDGSAPVLQKKQTSVLVVAAGFLYLHIRRAPKPKSYVLINKNWVAVGINHDKARGAIGALISFARERHAASLQLTL